MSENIVQHQYNGNVIPQRDSDDYVNATKMIAGFPGKKISHFLANKQTEAYLLALSGSAGIPADLLIIKTMDGPNELRGTWVHPEVAAKLAAWLSPEFEVWVFRTIVNVVKEQEAEPTPEPLPRQLPPHRDAIEYIEASKSLDQFDDCILTRLLRDRLVDELSLQQNNKLLSESKPSYTIVKVRASELGHDVAGIGPGSSLGRFVKKLVEPAFQEQVGRYKVWHYEITKELDDAINAFFS